MTTDGPLFEGTSPSTSKRAPRSPNVALPADKGGDLFPVDRATPAQLSSVPLIDPNWENPQRRSTRIPRARKLKPGHVEAPSSAATTPAPKWVTDASPHHLGAKVAEVPETAPITAVETRYAGCRFRSRLEARYAVWFDHLNIEWQYEPETYLVGPKGRRRGYLPDFFLPTDSIWVEVKGSEQALNYRLLTDAADPDHGLPRDLSGLSSSWPIHQVRLAILGPMPATPSLHAALSLVLGQTPARQLVTPFCDMGIIGHPEQVAKRHEHTLAPMYYPSAVESEDSETPEGLLTAFGYGMTCPQVVGAYTAARSARFEHGESG